MSRAATRKEGDPRDIISGIRIRNEMVLDALVIS